MAATEPTTYEVLTIRYGTRITTRSETYLNFHLYGEPDTYLRIDYFFWLIRGGGRTILLDCGYAAEPGARRGRDLLIDPVDALAGLGVDAAAVDQVVASHAHYDHIGNLHRFPNAEIVIARAEYEFFTGPYADRLLFAQPTEPDEIAFLSTAHDQGRLRLVDETLDLAPGFELVVVGGHTPGQMVAQVALPGGDGGPAAAVLASDALHFYEEVERDRPFFIVSDLVGMYRGYEALREMTQDPGRLLVSGHDPDVLRRFPNRVSGLPEGLTDLVTDITPA